jgi:hypothetical protein
LSGTDKISLAIWVAWVGFVHLLGLATAALYLGAGGETLPPVVVGFDPNAPVRAVRAGPLRLQVRCDRPATGLAVEVVADGAEPGVDYKLPASALPLAPDGTPTPLVVEVLDNPARYHDLTLRLELRSADGVAMIDPSRSVWRVVLPRREESGPEVQVVEVSFVDSRLVVGENQRRASARLKLEPPPRRPVWVPYRVGEGRTSELEVAAGQARAELPFDVPDDQVHSGDRVLSIVLQLGTGVRPVDPARLEVTVRDDEPEPVVRLEAVQDTVAEGSGRPLSFRVWVQPKSATEVTIRCRLAGPQAGSVAGLPEIPSLICLAPGTPDQVVTIPISDDKQPGPDRTFTLLFSDATGARLDPPEISLHFTVRDDDGLPGRALVLLVQTPDLAYDTIGGTIKSQLAQLFSETRRGKGSGVLLRDAFLVVRKGAEPLAWTPGTDPPMEPAQQFTRTDPLEDILNAAFDAAAKVTTQASSKDVLIVVLWPTNENLGKFAFDPAKVRKPADRPVRLIVIGTSSEGSDRLDEVFPRGRHEVRFLESEEHIKTLQDELDKLLDQFDPTSRRD